MWLLTLTAEHFEDLPLCQVAAQHSSTGEDEVITLDAIEITQQTSRLVLVGQRHGHRNVQRLHADGDGQADLWMHETLAVEGRG